MSFGKLKRTLRNLRREPLEPRELLAPVISEFMASNDTTLPNGNGEYSDWIEIHNPTNAAVDLSGWHLTDDISQIGKWGFIPTSLSTLAAGDHLVVMASGFPSEGFVDSFGYQHTNFKLKSGGDFLALTNANEELVYEFGNAYPPQQTDVSYGTDPATGNLVYVSERTPGAPNGEPAIADSIQLSRPSGTFTGSFSLDLAEIGSTAIERDGVNDILSRTNKVTDWLSVRAAGH